MKQSKKAGRLKTLSLFSIVLALALAGTASIASADGIPSPPNQFYGTITLNGNDAPAGTVIRAYVGDELRGSVAAATSGSYGFDFVYLDVEGNNDEVITFTVAGAPAAETITWDVDSGPRECDLTAEDYMAPVVSAPSATPNPIAATGYQLSRLNVTVTDDNGDIYRVTVDLSTIGGHEAKEMYCIDGNTYSTTTTAAIGTPNGTYYLQVNASDFAGNYDDSVYILLTVGDIEPTDWRYEWMGDGIVTTAELQDVAWHWLTGTRVNGYLLTLADIQEVIAMWLGAGAS